MAYWVGSDKNVKGFTWIPLNLFLTAGSSEILGRAIIGNSPEVRTEEKIFFEEIFRAKNATAQWVPLQEPATNLANTAKSTTNRN